MLASLDRYPSSASGFGKNDQKKKTEDITVCDFLPSFKHESDEAGKRSVGGAVHRTRAAPARKGTSNVRRATAR
jgi:hypothetical protein